MSAFAVASAGAAANAAITSDLKANDATTTQESDTESESELVRADVRTSSHSIASIPTASIPPGSPNCPIGPASTDIPHPPTWKRLVGGNKVCPRCQQSFRPKATGSHRVGCIRQGQLALELEQSAERAQGKAFCIPGEGSRVECGNCGREIGQQGWAAHRRACCPRGKVQDANSQEPTVLSNEQVATVLAASIPTTTFLPGHGSGSHAAAN